MVQQGRIINGASTKTKPTWVPEGSIYNEFDTEDKYRFSQYGRWDLIPPIGLKTKRLHSLFMPKLEQSGLIFGDSSWSGVNAELHSSGCMIYQIRTSASVIETNGFAVVNDLANVDMCPRFQMVFSFNDVSNKSAAFIGFNDDSVSIVETTAAFIPSGTACVGLGYKTTDTTYKIYHNDSSGAVESIDTLIPRDTDVYMLEVDFESSTSVWVRLFDIDKTLIYGLNLTSEIPGTGIDIGFTVSICNVDIVDQYAVNLFDYVRLEKTKPPLSPITDF